MTSFNNLAEVQAGFRWVVFALFSVFLCPLADTSSPFLPPPAMSFLTTQRRLPKSSPSATARTPRCTTSSTSRSAPSSRLTTCPTPTGRSRSPRSSRLPRPSSTSGASVVLPSSSAGRMSTPPTSPTGRRRPVGLGRRRRRFVTSSPLSRASLSSDVSPTSTLRPSLSTTARFTSTRPRVRRTPPTSASSFARSFGPAVSRVCPGSLLLYYSLLLTVNSRDRVDADRRVPHL
jgi:hypothetical protein